MKLILASGSPRRRELLFNLGLQYECVPSDIDETSEEDKPPEDLVADLAFEKASSVAGMVDLADSVVLGADTVVAIDGRVLGKPADQREAAGMLRLLSGREHAVYTGLVVLGKDLCITHVEKTIVHFRTLCESEILSYIKTGEPMDKAGSYAIQGVGSSLIERIAGDYFNVMGLPVCALCKLLLRYCGIGVL